MAVNSKIKTLSYRGKDKKKRRTLKRLKPGYKGAGPEAPISTEGKELNVVSSNGDDSSVDGDSSVSTISQSGIVLGMQNPEEDQKILEYLPIAEKQLNENEANKQELINKVDEQLRKQELLKAEEAQAKADYRKKIESEASKLDDQIKFLEKRIQGANENKLTDKEVKIMNDLKRELENKLIERANAEISKHDPSDFDGVVEGGNGKKRTSKKAGGKNQKSTKKTTQTKKRRMYKKTH